MKLVAVLLPLVGIGIFGLPIATIIDTGIPFLGALAGVLGLVFILILFN